MLDRKLDTPLDALEAAYELLECYRSDIRNSQWTGVDLLKKGFCQGHVYNEANRRIAAALDRFSPKPKYLTREQHVVADQLHDSQLRSGQIDRFAAE